MRVFLAISLTLWGGFAQAETDPAQLFAKSCSRCHKNAEALVTQMVWAPDTETAETRADWFDGFIARHHSPKAGDRATLAAWLSGLAGKDEP